MGDELENKTTVEQPEGGNPENPGAGASAKTVAPTQDELNKQFADRARQAESALLKKLGFENIEAAQTLIKAAKAAEDANKTELQKAQDRAAALEKERESLLASQKARAAQYDVAVKAAKIGIIDPDAAYRLLDQSKIEFDTAGNATNTEQLLKELLAEKPYLAGGSSSAANPAKNLGANGTFTREQLGDRKFYEAHREEIMKALKDGRIVD